MAANDGADQELDTHIRVDLEVRLKAEPEAQAQDEDAMDSSSIKSESPVDNPERTDFLLNRGNHGQKISQPITLLQEICSRNGCSAKYELLSSEGSVHEPTFKIAVYVADISATASGHSKKKAKHAAAREAIERLREKGTFNFEGINFDGLAPLEEPELTQPSTNEANPVGKLQEICMKMRVNPPDYDTLTEQGLAHERVFRLTCRITSLNLITYGDGRSKKLAKRLAAENMLRKLEDSEIYDKTTSARGTTESGASSLNMDSDDNSHFVRARRFATELCEHLNCSVDDLRQDIEMIQQDNVDEDLFYILIQETVSRIGHWRVDHITHTVCLLHIYDSSDNLVFTSHGSGVDNMSCMKDAVINAYNLMMVLLDPLTGVAARHRTAGSLGRAVAIDP